MAGWCVGQGLAPAGVLAYPGSLHRDSTGHLLLCYPLGLQYPLGMLKVSSHCRRSLVPVTGSVSFRSAETPATLFKVCSKRTVWCGRRCRTDETDSLGEEGKGEHRIHTILVTRKLEFIVSQSPQMRGKQASMAGNNFLKHRGGALLTSP